MLRNFMIFTTLLTPMLGLAAGDGKCRKVPHTIIANKKILQCEFNRESVTLTCNAPPDNNSPSPMSETRTFQYANVEAFVLEANLGSTQTTSATTTWQLTYGESMTQTTTYVYDGIKLITRTIAHSLQDQPFKTTYTAWDKKERPVAGTNNRAVCYGAGSSIGIYEDLPISIEYNDNTRKRTTIRYFNKARLAGAGVKCKSAIEKMVESYDEMNEAGKESASATEICIE